MQLTFDTVASYFRRLCWLQILLKVKIFSLVLIMKEVLDLEKLTCLSPMLVLPETCLVRTLPLKNWALIIRADTDTLSITIARGDSMVSPINNGETADSPMYHWNPEYGCTIKNVERRYMSVWGNLFTRSFQRIQSLLVLSEINHFSSNICTVFTY